VRGRFASALIHGRRPRSTGARGACGRFASALIRGRRPRFASDSMAPAITRGRPLRLLLLVLPGSSTLGPALSLSLVCGS